MTAVAARFDDSGASASCAWLRGFKDPSNDLEGLAAAAVPGGDFLLGGGVYGTMFDFGGGPLMNAAPPDAFLARLVAKDGTHVASKAFAGQGNQWITDIAITPKGGVVIEGAFDGTLDVAGTTMTAYGQPDVFIASLGAAP